MLRDGDEARQKPKNGKKNPISGDGSGVPTVVFGRKSLRRISLPKPLAGGIRMPQVQLPQKPI